MDDSKRYYWLKLKEDFFEDDTIRFLMEQKYGNDYCIFYLQLCLKSLKTGGRLVRLVGETLIPYDTKALSQLTGMREEIVIIAVELFLRYGILKQLDTGELYIQQVAEMVGSETYGAERKRKRRLQAIDRFIEKDMCDFEENAKKIQTENSSKNDKNVKITILKQKITGEKKKNGKISQQFPTYIYKEKELNKNKNKNISISDEMLDAHQNSKNQLEDLSERIFPLEGTAQVLNQNQIESSNFWPQSYEPNPPSSAAPPSRKKSDEKEMWEQEFEELWKLYPRKESKANGLKAYLKARKKGVSREVISEALKRYKQKVESEHTERKYIIKGGNWFSGERWEDEVSDEPEMKKRQKLVFR